MAGGRRNAKSNSFKHQGHNFDDRHADLPTQPQVIPPKHIPIPELPSASDLAFEVDALIFSLSAMAGQYINLYRSVFWLPYSHTDYALNYYLIDYNVLIVSIIMLGRRLPVCILKKLCTLCLPLSYQATYTLGVHIATSAVLAPFLCLCFYNVILEHGALSVVFLVYPLIVCCIVLGTDGTKFLELIPPRHERPLGARPKGTPSPPTSGLQHVCSMSAVNIRGEVETLRSDFNERWKQVLFNTFLVVYHAAFLPCYFSPSALHYDVNWAAQHAVFVAVGCGVLYVAHCFPPKYCDVLHRAALHLGRWQRVEIKNMHVPYSMWTEMSVFNQGALVKHSRELFKAEGISNAAEPGHQGQSRFYFLFKDPSFPTQLVWLLQLLLLTAEMMVLARSTAWNELVPLQLLIAVSCRTLYGLTKVHFVVRKIYHEEKCLISKFSS